MLINDIMKKYLFALLSLIIFSVGCTDRDDNITAVNLRVKNNNSFAYDKVQVGADDKFHENLAAGSYSNYLEYETAYQYDYIKIDTTGNSHVLQPIDFVGETALAPGFYTYELKIDTEGNVGLNFKRD